MFLCNDCTAEDRKLRGCVRPRRQPIQTYACPVCDGHHKQCKYCKGANEIKLKRCPRAILDGQIRMLVEYFFHFLKTNQFPDGRARLYQPVKLLTAFTIWENLYYELAKKHTTKDIETDVQRPHSHP